MLRLSTWQRLGIILSMSWTLYAVYERNSADIAQEKARLITERADCLRDKELVDFPDFGECDKSFRYAIADIAPKNWLTFMPIVLFPITCGWTAAFAVAFLIRLASTGRRA